MKNVNLKEWEYFCDVSYYDMWAVRPVGDKNFYSQYLFHVPTMEEAKTLKDLLESLQREDKEYEI